MAETRRKFSGWLIGVGLTGWLGSILFPIFSFLKPPAVAEASVNSVKVGLTSDFANNSGQIIKFGRTPVLVIRTDTGELRAFSATCTHLDCLVQYRDDFKHIWCACHNGHYDLQGYVVSGPPPRPLPEYQVSVVEDEVIISKPNQAG